MMLIARRCFFFTAFAIHCNKELFRLIVPFQKETTRHAKYHSTEDFRLKHLFFIIQPAIHYGIGKAEKVARRRLMLGYGPIISQTS